MKLFVQGRDPHEGFSPNLARVAHLDFLEVSDQPVVVEAAQLGEHGFYQLVGHDALADFNEIRAAHKHAASIWGNIDETFGDEPIDSLARGGPSQLEMIAQQRLVEPASRLQAHINDFGPDKVDRCVRLRCLTWLLPDLARTPPARTAGSGRPVSCA